MNEANREIPVDEADEQETETERYAGEVATEIYRARGCKAPSAAALDQADRLKRLAAELHVAIEGVPDARYRALAITALEESAMWAVKGITK